MFKEYRMGRKNSRYLQKFLIWNIMGIMSVQNFKNFLEKNNLKFEILETKEPTHTAQQAAQAHNIIVSNIVKSILVKIDNEFHLFLVPGDKRIDLEEKKKDFGASNCRIAKPDEVKNITGYSIGGVPPFGHKQEIKIHIEEGFDENEKILAAAGTPNSVFKTTLEELKKIIT
jgi:prolyl-tRNA editing enzyme YbaK/EbsC (Cys-tRNA(Pro) deacylase)